MKKQFILSIDQGTTGTTVSLINTKGQLSGRCNQEFRQFFPKPGWVEHDPEDIWQSVLLALKKLRRETGVQPKQILSLGLTNQRETVMAWDRKTGRALGNAIVWQCRRTTDFCGKLRKKGLENQVRKTTGLVLDPYFSGTKIHWLLKNNPEVKKRARQGQVCFGTVDSFLVWKLTGGQSFVTDVSNASRTLLMDLKSCDYSKEMLRLFSVRREMLPHIQTSGSLFGVVDRVPGILPGTPITGVLGDQQSALFGQLCFSPGDAKMTFGTGSFLLMNTGKKKVMSRKGLLTTVAWQLPQEKSATYALEGGAFICGAAVQWLRDSLGFFTDSSEIEKMAAQFRDCGGVQFVPSFVGLGAPYWDPEVRGAFLGLTRGSEKGHMARATLEAMALQNVDIVRVMQKEARSKKVRIRVDGGAAENRLLMQMQADFSGAKVVRPKNIETTSLGAAFMAGLGAGLWTSLKELKALDRVDREFIPSLSPSLRSKRIMQWEKAIAAVRLYAG